ncbi:hypothetical protein SD10_13470 [Spirosoma radiotolerans]|uniref:Uncharacterized protein n=1 Tax=Spirosoma radiotolerans TaxID=1379870 RepID=A0A0E3V7V0_9BACT|nr:hypothetical protein SD10_13470 [Spirosoma radiotolerans]
MKKRTVNWFGESTVQRVNRSLLTRRPSSRDDGDDVERENAWPVGKSWRKGNRNRVISNQLVNKEWNR